MALLKNRFADTILKAREKTFSKVFHFISYKDCLFDTLNTWLLCNFTGGLCLG